MCQESRNYKTSLAVAIALLIAASVFLTLAIAANLRSWRNIPFFTCVSCVALSLLALALCLGARGQIWALLGHNELSRLKNCAQNNACADLYRSILNQLRICHASAITLCLTLATSALSAWRFIAGAIALGASVVLVIALIALLIRLRGLLTQYESC
ncbi:MAG: hypothetical protein QM534_12515 [Sediminibacterium sp.]|nr:hypothetical protein [Sediminibacterium sp.]